MLGFLCFDSYRTLEKEKDRPRTSESQPKTHCEGQRTSIIALRGTYFCIHREYYAENEAQDLIIMVAGLKVDEVYHFDRSPMSNSRLW